MDLRMDSSEVEPSYMAWGLEKQSVKFWTQKTAISCPQCTKNGDHSAQQ